MIPMFSTFYTALIDCYSKSTERGTVQDKTIKEGQTLSEDILQLI
jgi:predicted secreted protein